MKKKTKFVMAKTAAAVLSSGMMITPLTVLADGNQVAVTEKNDAEGKISEPEGAAEAENFEEEGAAEAESSEAEDGAETESSEEESSAEAESSEAEDGAETEASEEEDEEETSEAELEEEQIDEEMEPLSVIYAQNVFTDVEESDWFYSDVQYLYDRGLMTGMNRTTFNPNGSASRAEIAKIFYRVSTSPNESFDSMFVDVTDGYWYTTSVNWISHHGIMTGYENGFFGPSDDITREQMATVIYRYAATLGRTSGPGSYAVLDNYSDSDDISSFAQDAVTWCIQNGIMGQGVNEIAPTNAISRAEAAAMMVRMIKKYGLEFSDHYHVHPDGMDIPHWYQDDPEWANDSYGGGTVMDNACGPVCAAMLSSYFTGELLTPRDILDEIRADGESNYWANGTKNNLFTEFLQRHYGIKCKSLGTDTAAMIAELQAGHPVVARLNKKSWRTGSGHFVVYRGLTADGNYVLVNDPLEVHIETREEKADPISSLDGTVREYFSFYE